MPATNGHAKYLIALQAAIRKAGGNFSVLGMSYTLTDDAPYPKQLQQAVALLKYLVDDQKRDPETVSFSTCLQMVFSNVYRFSLVVTLLEGISRAPCYFILQSLTQLCQPCHSRNL
jgi:hypothetical protein